MCKADSGIYAILDFPCDDWYYSNGDDWIKDDLTITNGSCPNTNDFCVKGFMDADMDGQYVYDTTISESNGYTTDGAVWYNSKKQKYLYPYKNGSDVYWFIGDIIGSSNNVSYRCLDAQPSMFEFISVTRLYYNTVVTSSEC